ncbi:MAG: BTAD domain-containing putative transcriptional regulator [Anaerolineae bacterium]
MLTLGRADLAFTAAEIEALFRQEYRCPLSAGQASALEAETEGWAIALQMVWQTLQGGALSGLDEILGQLPSTLDTLFDYLAQDVLARQPAAIQRFLLATCVLRQMDGPACDHLLATQGSAATLHRLHEGGLFVVAAGDDAYRYHRLFHDFLRAHLGRDPQEARALHRRAAAYFRQAGHPEETVYHRLQAGDYEAAAELVEELGPGLVAVGRFDSLSAWIAHLAGGPAAGRAGLYLLQGDVMRLRARFDEALEHYVAAEARFSQQADRVGRSRALRGQAQVYLDTVRPLKADSLLEEALRLLEPDEHRDEAAALLDQLAENKLNLGYPHEAQALHHEAQLLRAETDPADLFLEARALFRTGRLEEARRLLDRQAEEEGQADQTRPQRFHRETFLLLSLVHILQGDAERAERWARRGIAVGRRLGSPYVEAVGYMRLGHAVQMQEARAWDTLREGGAADRPGGGSQWAIDCYGRAIELVRTFKVMRTQVEPLWGLCRAYGFHGDLAAAEGYAGQALDIIRRAGDEWMQDLIQVVMGAGYALAGRPAEARRWLREAADGFGRVGDPFGQAAAGLWLALDAWWGAEREPALAHFARVLALARAQGYDDLLLRPTFLGPDDAQAVVPLLLAAVEDGIEAQYAAHLLQARGLAGLDYHPGYGLSVRTLGPFGVWRNRALLGSRDWRREKARQLFQFLLTHRGQWFYREQIVDQLWPHLPPDAADRDFKVALNALNRALEPARPRGASPFFVVRRDNVYGLNPAAGLVVDVDDLERLAAEEGTRPEDVSWPEDEERLALALALYEDDYLPDSLYEDWSAAERQRLRHLYLVTAERLARRRLRERRWDEALELSRAILARDLCWEAAYRLQMQVYAALNNRSQVHAVYQRCADALREELSLEPSPATQSLFHKLA